MRFFKSFTLVVMSLALLNGYAEEYENSGMNAQLKVGSLGASTNIHGADDRDLDYPMHIIFKVTDEGKVRVEEASWAYFNKHESFEQFGGVEVDMQLVGAYYRELHEEIGRQAKWKIADITVSKAYQLSDGVTFILAGHGSLTSPMSVYLSDNAKERLAPQPEGQKERDGKAYSQDTVNMDIAASGVMRFKYKKGEIVAEARYTQRDSQNFQVYGSEEHMTLDEREAKLELSYKPHLRKGSKFTLGIKQNEFDRSMGGANDTVKDTQVYLRYEYEFNMNNFFGNYDDEDDSIVEEYIEDELDLPEIY